MICHLCQPTCNLPSVYLKPTLSTLLRSIYRPKPTRQEAISFAIMQSKTGKEIRIQRNLFRLSFFNPKNGGKTYGKSLSEYNAGKLRKKRLLAHMRKRHLNNIKVEEIIATETKRLSDMFGKSFLDCEDLIKLTGLGRDNVRLLMRSRRFPVMKVGKRQVVSILNFVTWQIRESAGGDYNGR